MNNIMKKLLIIFLLFFVESISAQEKIITLDEAIKIAQKQSPDYIRLLNWLFTTTSF